MTDSSRVRVSIVGVVVVALFSALLGRLWFLQVGSGAVYVEAARENSVRVVQSESPRGRILDRNGDLLVDNRVLWAVTVSRDLSSDQLEAVLGSLSELLAEPVETLRKHYDDPRRSRYKPAVVAAGIPEAARITLRERKDDFPGVDVEELPVRVYPNGTLAAHVLGYTGQVNEEELKERRGDYVLGDTIGRAGIERAYERVLRGQPQRITVEVDPRGNVVGNAIDTDPGAPGHDVVLTIDREIQRVAEETLLQAIEAARKVRNDDIRERLELFKAPGGAVVVLDATDGSVVAMASSPTYAPAEFIGGISQEQWEFLNAEANHYPLNNRATQGAYAPGSTFKPVTAIAAMQYGLRGEYTPYDDVGYIEVEGQRFRNAGDAKFGRIDLRPALAYSSDTYFFDLGRQFWRIWRHEDQARGLGIQAVSRQFGFGTTTGIELGESAGVVPDPDWKEELARVIHHNDEDRRLYGIWYPGDQINMSVGQGDVLVTPLQLANMYAALANDGTLWTPHLMAEVRDASGGVVQSAEPERARTITIDPSQRQAVLDGLVSAVRDGTARGAFSGFPLDLIPVAGKTGTAQVGSPTDPKGDTALFAGYFPAHQPRYVVVAVVEEAGFGGDVAAPIVRRVIEAMNDLPLSTIASGKSGAVD